VKNCWKIFRNGDALILLALFLLLTLTGCQTGKSSVQLESVGAEPAGAETAVPGPGSVSPLTLGPGDVLDIRFFYNPELNDTQSVRPDGKITLQLIGEIMVQGKAPEELRDELARLYAPELRKPEVTIIVRGLNDRRVYVGGEVNKPGVVPMPGRLTALEAINEAGGFKIEMARVKSVVVIRRQEGRLRGSLIDFSGVLKGKQGSSFLLEPRDIIYVPQTAIVNVDQWVDQYIRKILPVQSIGIGVSWLP